MAYRRLANNRKTFLGPTAPRKYFPSAKENKIEEKSVNRTRGLSLTSSHPLTDLVENKKLQCYESETKESFDRIVPLLKKISALQHEEDFVGQAQLLAKSELGIELPIHILEKAWVQPLDMRALFAACVFKAHEHSSENFSIIGENAEQESGFTG